MINRKLSLGLVLILFAAQAVAMKRSGGDLIKSESAKEKLNKAIELCNPDKFAKVIHHDPNLVNVKINKEPVVFVFLNKLDKRVARSQHTTQTQWSKGTTYSRDMEAKHEADREKNNDEITQLHQCLEMVINHENFDMQCTNTCGVSVVMSLLGRPSTPLYSSATERTFQLEGMQPILSALLKKDIAAVDRPDGDGLGLLHYATRMPIHYKEYVEGVDGVDEDIDVNNLADFYVKSEHNALEAIETVVHAGANINSVTVLEGDTPLHLAVTDLTKTSLLVALGADTNIKNKDGQIPADISKNPRVVEILNNPKKHIEDINNHILQNGARETSLKNPCPYTRAVLQKHQDIFAIDMAWEIVTREIMGDELVSDEDSQPASFDEDTSML